MRHINPIVDYNLRQAELDRREANSFCELTLDDVLDEPVEIDGMQFDIKVRADFVKDGEHGSIEISYIDFGEVYAYLSGLSDPHMLLNQEQFKSRHSSTYKKLIKAVTDLAIKKASASNDWTEEYRE